MAPNRQGGDAAGQERRGRKQIVISLLILFFLSVLLMLRQLASPYYFSCALSDAYQYFGWAWQFRQGLHEGVAYPRWTPLQFGGYGSPTFILYPPLVFYMVSAFGVFLKSLVTAMNITKFFSVFASASGMFLLVREYYSDRVALLSGALYILFPLYVRNLYISGAFTSTVSLMWFPFILLFVFKNIKSGRSSHLLFAGACYGGLILTHLINAYMFTFVLTALMIFMVIAKKRPAGLAGLLIIVITGVLLSSAYLFPLLYEKRFLNYRVFPGNYADLFILPNHVSRVDPRYFWAADYAEYASFAGLLLVVTLLLLRMLRMRKTRDEKTDTPIIAIFFVCVSFFSIFVTCGISQFIWKTVPFFTFVQIPVRWLNISMFAVAFLSSVFFSEIGRSALSTRKRLVILVLPFILCLMLDSKYVFLACPIDEREVVPVKTVDASEYLPQGVDMARIYGKGDSKERVLIVRGKGEAEVVLWQSEERVFRTSADGKAVLRVRTFNFPGWTAYVDGVRSEPKTEEGTGAMLIDIPNGAHRLVLKFSETPLRYWAKLISALSFSALLVFALLGDTWTSRRKK